MFEKSGYLVRALFVSFSVASLVACTFEQGEANGEAQDSIRSEVGDGRPGESDPDAVDARHDQDGGPYDPDDQDGGAYDPDANSYDHDAGPYGNGGHVDAGFPADGGVVDGGGWSW